MAKTGVNFLQTGGISYNIGASVFFLTYKDIKTFSLSFNYINQSQKIEYIIKYNADIDKLVYH